jgi:hypothetical protein
MFFLLSKSVSFLLLPSNILIAIGLVGIVLMLTRRRRVGAWIAMGVLFCWQWRVGGRPAIC